MTISGIQDKIKTNDYRFSEHTLKQMILRRVERYEITEAILNGKIIEDYPDDKYSPSCLIYGVTSQGRDLHVVVSLPPKVVVITVYEPNENEWINFSIRK